MRGKLLTVKARYNGRSLVPEKKLELAKGEEVELTVFVRIGKAKKKAGQKRVLWAKDDPIWNLGKNPVPGGPKDGAENHDKYLYGKP